VVVFGTLKFNLIQFVERQPNIFHSLNSLSSTAVPGILQVQAVVALHFSRTCTFPELQSRWNISPQKSKQLICFTEEVTGGGCYLFAPPTAVRKLWVVPRRMVKWFSAERRWLALRLQMAAQVPDTSLNLTGNGRQNGTSLTRNMFRHLMIFLHLIKPDW